MNNFAGFLGVSLGRQFITMTGDLKLTIGRTVMGNKQLILLLTAVFMMMGVFVIYRLAKKATAEEQTEEQAIL